MLQTKKKQTEKFSEIDFFFFPKSNPHA